MKDTTTSKTLRDVDESVPQVLPVILAGGSGTRLWPLSRENHPKQLIGFLTNESLLSSTSWRLNGIENARLVNELLVVCGEQHKFLSAAQLHASGTPARILLEPAARNTAPALTLAALDARARHGDPVLAVMPADHVVTDTKAFQHAVAQAAQYAQNGAIVTLGVLPRRAETGYGYIKLGVPLPNIRSAARAHTIEQFVEKPHQELAQQYLESGEYWWNSGIFVVRASTWLAAIEALQPEIFFACDAAWSNGTTEGDFFKANTASFETCPSDSIDYAVMERLTGVEQSVFPTGIVVPLAAGWSDVGSWDAIWEIMPKDPDGNVGRGRVMFEEAEDCFAHSDGRLVACVGLKNVVVVETADAVLVVDKNEVQRVKSVVARLKSEQLAEAQDHRKVHRPWGHYDSLAVGERFQVKSIVVAPGKQLSLQMHYHRAEHWIVVRGTAKVTCGERTFLLSENESTYIAVGTVHRLENPGKTPLEIIEVQSGHYLGEDDIVRFDDQYGRADAAPGNGAPAATPSAGAQLAPAREATVFHADAARDAPAALAVRRDATARSHGEM